jgi:hypothetical protein
MKKLLIALAIVVAGVSGCSKKASDTVGKAVIDTALQVSPMDAAMLTEITSNLERACESGKNKFGLSADECTSRLNARKDICVQQTARQFPGTSNLEKMQEMMAAHVECLFKG